MSELIERLRKADYDTPYVWDLTAEAADALEAKGRLIAELVEALSEATDEIESWGAYAGEYFQEKHDLKGVIKQFRDIYSNAKEQE